MKLLLIQQKYLLYLTRKHRIYIKQSVTEHIYKVTETIFLKGSHTALEN